MSTEREPETSQAIGLTRDDAIRAMLVLMPRVAQRIKRTTVPEQLRSMNPAPGTSRSCPTSSSTGRPSSVNSPRVLRSPRRR